MAKWVHANVLDGGLNYLKNNCDKIALVSGYAAGDPYATVTAAILAEAPMTASDLVITSSGSDRVLTTAAGKQDAAANASNTTGQGAGNHIVFLNTAGSEVLWATEETSDQDIVSGNPVTFPSLTYTAKQPV